MKHSSSMVLYACVKSAASPTGGGDAIGADLPIWHFTVQDLAVPGVRSPSLLGCGAARGDVSHPVKALQSQSGDDCDWETHPRVDTPATVVW